MTSLDILKAVSEVFEVPLAVISSRSINREVVDARYTAYYYLLKELGFSAQRVARIMQRDRSMYSHALKKFEGAYQTDRAFKRKADAVAAKLNLEVAL